MSLCKASAFGRLVVNPFRRTILLVNQVMTSLLGRTWPFYVYKTQIPCEVGCSRGDLCALSKAGLTPFDTGPI